jgi:type IV secretory pathway VirD2 relaxase
MAFARRGLNDRHHFRFLVTSEDAAEMTDPKAFTRDPRHLVGQMESDLGTRPGVGIVMEHRHPRSHPVIRGVADDGSDPQARRLAVGRLQKLERMGLPRLRAGQ